MLKTMMASMIDKFNNRKLRDYYDPFSGTVMIVPNNKRHRM